MMRWRDLLIMLTAITVLLGSTAFPEPAAQVRRVGDFSDAFDVDEAALRDTLRELGWVDGENLIFDWRSTDGRKERLPALAADLVRLGPGAVRPPPGAASAF